MQKCVYDIYGNIDCNFFYWNQRWIDLNTGIYL